MKATGIVRRIDELGRAVIPKLLCRNKFRENKKQYCSEIYVCTAMARKGKVGGRNGKI